MGTTADKLNKILETKAAIKSAIISKGVEVADGTKFADYPSKIAAISGGGSSEADTYYEDLFNQRTTDGTNMSYLFYNSSSSEIDVSRIDTSKATNMSSMFQNCKKLTSLDVSNFDTSNVTSMTSMFYYCSNLTSLDVSNFDTSKVTTMQNMFYECNKLTSLDVSNFDTSNVTNMADMFYYCSNLTSLDLSDFDTSKVTSMSSMFYDCYALTSLDLSNFDTSNVTSIWGMFFWCNSLHTLRLDNCSNDTVSDIINSGNFPTGTIDGVTRTIYCTERAASGLTAPSGWVFSFVDGEEEYCIEYTVDNTSTYALNGGGGSGAGAYKYGLPRIYSDASTYTFDGYEDIEITLLDGTTTTDVTTTCNQVAKVKIWYPADTKAVKFYGSSSKIKTVDYCNTSKFTDMSNMFYQNYNSLTELDATNWDTSNVTNMMNMFYQCELLTSLDLSNWDTSKVTNMTQAFYTCWYLTILDVSNWDTSNVTTMFQTFAWCANLTTLDLSNWDVSKVTSMSYMFDGCKALANFTAPKNISAAVDFSACTNLTHDSLMSIINNLTTVTSTKKLTLGSTNLAKLTTSEKAIATNKGWTLA